MKRILSILAVITGAVYLISGISVLAFQDVVKVAMGYGAEYEADLLKVYPIQNILELAVMGIPCVVLGFLSMPESTFRSVGMNMLLILYSGAMLTLGGLLISAGNFIDNIITSRTMGVEGVVSMNIISTAFGRMQFLINFSLVLLLLRGAFGMERQ